MRFLAILALALSLSACVNNIEKFYKPNGGPPPSSKIIPHIGDAVIERVNYDDLFDSVLSKMEEGYIFVGESSFRGDEAMEQHIQSVARQHQAAVVLFGQKYSNTSDRSFMLSTPTTETTYHSGTINNYSSGMGTTYLSGSSTTYGTKNTWIPYQVDQYHQHAVFLVKKRPGGFGVLARDMKPEERKKTNSNLGTVISVVFKGSSAFRANLMRDDIIISVDNINIEDGKHFFKTVWEKLGQQKVPVTFWRDGNVYTVFMDIDTYEDTPLS